MLNFIGDLVTTGANIWQQERDRKWNAGEAQKNRDFQSAESAAQRDWSSQEAERARDWNEEMYYKYNSLSGKIAQAEQAGVNPMLAITGNATSPMSAQSPMPSGATAGSVGTPTSHFVDLVGSLMNLRESKARIEKMEQETAGIKINNETLREMNALDIVSKRANIDYTEENTALVTQKILTEQAEQKVKTEQLGLIASQIASNDADASAKYQSIQVMLSEIAKNEKSLDVMTSQIAEIASKIGVNAESVNKMKQEIDNLKQDYDHKAIVNGFEQAIMSEKAGTAKYWDTNDENVSKVERAIAELVFKPMKDIFKVSLK